MTASLTPYSSVLSQQGYCNICYSPYDLEQVKPLLICTNYHSICKQCLLAIKHRPLCPFCRAPVKLNRIRINPEAYRLIVAASRKSS